MFDLRHDRTIAHLVLSRPDARNAVPLNGWSRIAELIGEAERAGARVVVIYGEGGFCAGADINEFDRFREDPEARAAFRLAMRVAFDAIAASPLPVVAAIDGACYGAGVALAMACDIRLASTAARLAITPAKLGIAYPQQDIHRLVSLVGPGQAARLLLGAGSINGAEAARIGLVDIVVGTDAVGAALELATSVAANDPVSLQVLKRGIALAAAGVAADEGQDRAFDRLLGSDALAAGLNAHRRRTR